MPASVIGTNVFSLNAQRNLNKNSLGLATALERLSSGLRVNSAKDDAAGLAVGLSMESAARGIAAGIRNNSDQISVAQTADGALQSMGDILLRMSELDSQATSASLGTTEKGYIQLEFAALIAAGTAIQGAALLNGQTVFGSNGINSVAAVATTAGASSAGIATALAAVAASRANAGARINSLNFTIQSQETTFENQMSARSRIMDADFAAETAALSRSQVLQQAGTAMVAQANAIPQNVLTLLR